MQTQKISNSQNFTGNVSAYGMFWPSKVKKAFKNNAALQQLSQKGYEVVGKIDLRFAHPKDINHKPFSPTYRISISVIKDTFLGKLKALLGLKSTKTKMLTYHYHSAESSKNIIRNKLDAEFIKNKFRIEL